MRLALAGHPNCGKSTLFNALCGTDARIGNYPGVTVERHEATLSLADGRRIDLVDLPGCNSLIARSPEEEIAFAELCGQFSGGAPDGVLLVLDATQVERGLYLLLQIQELGLPVMLVLNMIDRAHLEGRRTDVEAIQRGFFGPIVQICARDGAGLGRLRQRLVPFCERPAAARNPAPLAHLQLSTEQQAALGALHAQAQPRHGALGLCLWLLCAEPAQASSCLAQLAGAPQRALAAEHLLERLRHQVDAAEPGSFAQAMIARRYAFIDAALAEPDQAAWPPSGAALPTGQRAAAADSIGRLDSILLHPIWGPSIFLGVMFSLFQLAGSAAAPLMEAVGGSTLRLAAALAPALPGELSRSLWLHGIGTGVANVLSFVPQIALLFLGIALLEDSGYMARAAFVADALMRRVGLQGRAFVPLLSSFACAVPGVMACRTLARPHDRLLTIFIAPFMSCSARLPVYTLVIGAVFAEAPPLFGLLSIGGLVILAMYLLGFVAALGTAWALRKGVLRQPSPPLLLELPRLQRPHLLAALRQTTRRCRDFVTQSGPLIVALSMLLWGALTYPQRPLPPAVRAQQLAAMPAELHQDGPGQTAFLQRQERAYRLRDSWGGRLGHAIEPLIAPLGFDWRIGVGLIASFAAREVLVSTLAQIYALDAEDPGDAATLGALLRQQIDPQTGKPRLTPLTGLSLMVFFVLAMQCLSTVATVRRETQSWRWPLAQLVYMNALAYLASWLVYQGGRACGWS
jgi:ferrous iron transport protein B